MSDLVWQKLARSVERKGWEGYWGLRVVTGQQEAVESLVYGIDCRIAKCLHLWLLYLQCVSRSLQPRRDRIGWDMAAPEKSKLAGAPWWQAAVSKPCVPIFTEMEMEKKSLQRLFEGGFCPHRKIPAGPSASFSDQFSWVTAELRSAQVSSRVSQNPTVTRRLWLHTAGERKERRSTGHVLSLFILLKY